MTRGSVCIMVSVQFVMYYVNEKRTNLFVICCFVPIFNIKNKIASLALLEKTGCNDCSQWGICTTVVSSLLGYLFYDILLIKMRRRN